MTAKKEQPKEVDTMHIWDAVCKTDPKFTKQFNKGGYKGTASNPTYLIRKATALWGAAGYGWGYNIIDEKYVDGAPIVIDKTAVCREVIHVVLLEFWYNCNGEIVKTPPQFGQTTFVGKNKNGVFTDEEAPKKSVTDAMVKCMSMLGFSADIFMGMYDDIKYLNSLKDESGETITKASVQKVVEDTLQTPEEKASAWVNQRMVMLSECKTHDEYRAITTKKGYMDYKEALKDRMPDILEHLMAAEKTAEDRLTASVINDEIRH